MNTIVVFDLDHTLVETRPLAECPTLTPSAVMWMGDVEYGVYVRPWVRELVRDCFLTFGRYGIWTHASHSYAQDVVACLRLPMSPEFVYAVDAPPPGVAPHVAGDFPRDLAKPLEYIDMAHHCTALIVEDTVENCRYNMDRAVIVPRFYADDPSEYRGVPKLVGAFRLLTSIVEPWDEMEF